MNTRCVEILNLFLNSNNDIKVDDLANRFSISNRMIRYDIDEINSFLRGINFKEIDKKPNSPLRFSLSKEEKEVLRNHLNNINLSNYIYSTEERVAILLYELLSSKGECNYKVLQDKLLISKTTLFSDIKKVKLWLEEYYIKIIKVSNKGFKIQGKESNIRIAMTDLLIDSNKYNINTTLEKIYNNNSKNIYDNLTRFDISIDNLDYIKELISGLEEEVGVFSEEDYTNLVIVIFVIVNRSYKNDEIIDELQVDFNKVYQNEYKAAKKLSENLNDKYGVVLNDNEINLITSKILSGSKNKKNLFESADYFNACHITDRLIKNVRIALDKEFKMDNSLLESLINHMKSLIFRLKYNILSTNPIIDTIQSNYAKEFQIVKESSKFIEDKFQCKLSIDEIGYLVMYIVAAIEQVKKEDEEKIKNVLIVCSAGFATGRLLEAKIRDHFNVNIVAVTSIHGINKYLSNNNIDYIISTINLDDNIEVPVVKISPILFNRDLDRFKNIFPKRIVEESIPSVDGIIEIVEKYSEIVEYAKLKVELSNYIKGVREDFSNLNQFIPLENIQLNLEVSDWKEAIRLSAKPLLINKDISKEYIDAMIENVEKLGAYIVVDDGIAIPHAKPDKYVNNFGVTINTFKNPITLGEHNNVRIFITIASVNNENHIKLITQIMKLIENESFINGLINSKERIEVKELLDNVNTLYMNI
ncbi:BglG family transcription antiterminator [Clostridium sp. MB05]|uniref:BglG family transcription antiterminator n=1 Tax=Clostridium sp. MB05 TaxID=3376682 RepID=UPI003981D1E7